MVTALLGRTGQLGCTQQGTFFLQRLVEGVGGEVGAALLLHEDILDSVGMLAVSEVTSSHILPLSSPRQGRGWCRQC